MAENYLTFETSQNLPMQDSSVTETTNTTYAGVFPTGFQTAGSSIMVVCDLNIDGSRRQAIQSLERMIKSINQSVNFLK